MKKIIIILFVLLLIPLLGRAEISCPQGKIYCEGECGLFNDLDYDGICDQVLKSTKTETPEENDLISGKDLKEKTVKEIAEIYQINADTYAQKLSEIYKIKIKTSDHFQLLHDNYELEPSVVKKIALALKNGEDFSLEVKKNKKVYHLIPITLILTLIYLTTFFLSKKKIISVILHKRIWNILLLLSLLSSGILGIFLIIKVNFGLNFTLAFNILFWHAELGIVLLVVSVFHVVERWYYFKAFLK